jgi:histidinol dehydrogenase
LEGLGYAITKEGENSLVRVIDIRNNKELEEYLKLVNKTQMDMGNIYNSVDEIVSNVRAKGDRAVIDYTMQFDKIELTSSELRVSKDEITEAYGKIDQKLLDVIRKAKSNIENFHAKQKEKSWFSTEENGVFLGQLYRALEVVGVYVPGGSAPLPSSVLMNVIPAKVAGVERIIMSTPPGKDGSINPAILVAANEAGANEIYKAGGAQAIAALAFGTQTIPKVDKIVGPGNIYVNMAKRIVFGYCGIDMFAGPSDITVIADETAKPSFVAADLLSQSEHDPLSAAILVTTSEALADKVKKEIKRQYEYLSRKDILDKSLKDNCAIVIVNNLEEAVETANRIAPEHLEVCVQDPFSLLGSIKNAGAIFLGNYATEPLGDYFAGPNHVLPTSGTSRFFSPLNVADFMKKSSVISYTKSALEQVCEDVVLFAEAEGLDAHANAIKVRFEE